MAGICPSVHYAYVDSHVYIKILFWWGFYVNRMRDPCWKLTNCLRSIDLRLFHAINWALGLKSDLVYAPPTVIADGWAWYFTMNRNLNTYLILRMFWLLELSDTLGLLYCRAFFKRFSFQLVCSRNCFRLDPQAVVSLGVLRPDPGAVCSRFTLCCRACVFESGVCC